MVNRQLDKDFIINFLRTNKFLLEQEFGVIKIALFGSYARNEQTEKSDIDLVIETNTPSFKKRCSLKEFLESRFERKVDLCYFRGMRSFIRHSIEKELVYA